MTGTAAVVLTTGAIGMAVRATGDGDEPSGGGVPALAVAAAAASPTVSPSPSHSPTPTAGPTREAGKKPGTEPEREPAKAAVAVDVTKDSGSTKKPAAKTEATEKAGKSSKPASSTTKATQSTISAADLPPLVSAGVPVSGGMTARAYYGQLDSMIATLDGTVTFNTSPAWLMQHNNRCVLTVVYSGVSGSTASVYAHGQGSGWSASENAPDQSVSADGGRVHHQLISPPSGTSVGSSWSLSSSVVVDGTTTSSGSYSLSLTSQDGTDQIWSFAGSKVSCDLL
ncbi:hypothetical protein KIH74_28115 [Kineosporia sp. J2-2]|uniref:Secreted protein n=1 Tax=Kineosporia corallincola TaxID=2835133 RepID=A0ABS5TPB4_9ACTN|nr:hypothetical protein [Kineosporia corallincola]MBT0772840.1 hypothetical protein [Kineosporia corallincola]